MNHTTRSWLLDILLLALGIGSIYALFLGSHPLGTPDEARYTEIAREMLASGHFLIPHINGIKYFEKPPLFYWLQAFSLHCFGIHEWAARLPNMFMAVIACIANYCGARYLFSRASGILSACILATSLLFYFMGHSISLDMTFTALLSISLLSFISALQSSPYQRGLIWNAFLFAGLAVLTKSLIGIIFPIMIVGLWVLSTSQWQQLTSMHLLSAALIFLTVALPWHILIQIQEPSFFHYHFIEQQFLRFGTKQEHFDQPWWMYFPLLCIGILPWLVFLPQTLFFHTKAIVKNRLRHTNELFLLLWAGSVLIFFTFSHSKLIPYIMPCFAPLTILISQYLIETNKNMRFIAGIVAFSTITFVTLLAKCQINTEDSLKPLALHLKKISLPHQKVFTYGHYYHDLPVYLERTVTIVNWHNELAFGAKFTPNIQLYSVDEHAFWKHWRQNDVSYLIIDKTKYERIKHKHTKDPLIILTATKNDLLISNKEPPL